jgi:serine/threonine protein kinase
MSEERVIAGRYRLIERLGSGGMGVVWKAHDERLRRTVAVKQVLVPAGLTAPQTEEIVRRTMREGRIAAKLTHPQLITVYDVIEDGGEPYLIMEYLPSTSLSQLLADRGTLPPEEVAAIGAEAAAALAAAHAAGVVHRDVKPANILIGDDGTVKITDFGVSRVVADITGTTTGTFAGTPAYLSPEVAKGSQATFASDVYSLGATLYTAVEGNPPAGSNANPMATLYRVASGEIDPPKNAGTLTDVLLSLLNADPDRRPTMPDARAALAGSPTAPVEPPPPAAPVAPAGPVGPAGAVQDKAPARRRRAVVLAVGLLVVALVAAGATLLFNRDDDTPSNADGANPTDSSNSSNSSDSSGSSDSSTTRSSEPATTTSAKPTTTTTVTTTTAPAVPPEPADPAAAISAYYALMPGNRDAGWARLSPRFQASPAGGRASYDGYWSGMSAVSVSDVAPGAGNTVEVTVLYTRVGGSQVRERHRYTLVNQGGRWLLDQVVVLSSTGLA